MAEDLTGCITGLVYGYKTGDSIIQGHKRMVVTDKENIVATATNVNQAVGIVVADMIENHLEPFQYYMDANANVDWKDDPDFELVNFSANFSLFENAVEEGE